jgi:hypothetical protein
LLPGTQRRLRGLLVVSLLALAWWATWVFDPGNFAPPILFVVVAAAQALDLLAVLGFWHAIWPRRRPQPPFATVRGRASILVLTHGQPIHVVEQTLQAAVAVHRHHRVFLAGPSERPELRWLAGWYGVRRLTPGMEELDEIAGARFLAVIEAGQLPRPDFLQRLLPYFADRSVALVQAWYGRGKSRAGVRDAILRGGDSLDEAWCLGTNYVLRRSALQSIGGFGPRAASPAGALRLAAALRADRWRTRYVGERLTVSLDTSGWVSSLAEAWRRAVAQLAVALRPGSQARGTSWSARFFAVWATMRYPALLGLPVSAVAVAVYATREPLPLRWLLNLVVHLVPYLVLRGVVRIMVAVRGRAADLPLQQPEGEAHLPEVALAPQPEPALEPEPAPAAAAESQQEAEPRAGEHAPIERERELEPAANNVEGPEAQELFDLVPEIEPQLHLGWRTLSSRGPDASTVPPEPAAEPSPVDEPDGALRPRLAVVAAWIVTTAMIGTVTLAVIQSNPPQRPASVQRSSAPPYSYYSPAQPP